MEKTKNFIDKAKKIHGNKYDYSKVEYINAKQKICIICPIHGEFWQTPNSHLNGCGCKLCGYKTISIKTRKKKKFLSRKQKKFTVINMIIQK